MEDEEARHVIDQYNKLLSYTHTEYQVAATYLAVATAVMALVLSVGNFTGFIKQQDPSATLSVLVASCSLAILLILRWRQRWRVTEDLRAGREKILLLEDYRGKHKILPEPVTLRTICHDSPEQLRKRLGIMMTSPEETHDTNEEKPTGESARQGGEKCVIWNSLGLYSRKELRL